MNSLRTESDPTLFEYEKDKIRETTNHFRLEEYKDPKDDWINLFVQLLQLMRKPNNEMSIGQFG